MAKNISKGKPPVSPIFLPGIVLRKIEKGSLTRTSLSDIIISAYSVDSLAEVENENKIK